MWMDFEGVIVLRFNISRCVYWCPIITSSFKISLLLSAGHIVLDSDGYNIEKNPWTEDSNQAHIEY